MFGIFKKKQVKEKTKENWLQEWVEKQEKQLNDEVPFISIKYNNQSVPIKPSDLITISTLMGFAWKHAGMKESEASLYAVWTFLIYFAGSDDEKASANITIDSSMSWSLENGFMLKLADSSYCKNKIIEYLANLKK